MKGTTKDSSEEGIESEKKGKGWRLIKKAIRFQENYEWKIIIALSIYFEYAVQIYVISFFTSFRGYNATRIVADVIYISDVTVSILCLTTAKKLQHGVQPKRKWILSLDIASLFSFDYLLNFGANPRSHAGFIIMQILFFLRLNKLLDFTVFITKRIGQPNIYRVMLRMAMLTYFSVHTLSCLWCYINGFETGLWTRGLNSKTVAIRGIHDKFSIVTYFVVVLFCNVGLGDIVPITSAERLLSVFVMITGITWLSAAVAIITSHVNESLQHHFEYSTHIRLIQRDLSENRSIPRFIRDKIMDYYQRLWIYKEGVVSSELFDELPGNMRNTVHVDRYWKAMLKSTLLCDLDVPSKRALAPKFRSQMFVKDDIIIKQGELRTFMMFIVHGFVRVLSYEDTESTVMLLAEGSLLFELSLIVSTPSPVQVVAGSFCELYILDRMQLYEVAVDYRQISDLIHNNFIDLWYSIIIERDARAQEEAVSRMMGIPVRTEVGEKYAYVEQEPDKPYTWLHQDEMIHLVARKTTTKKSFDVYILAKVTSQVSDELCARANFPFVFQPGTSLLLWWDFFVAVVAVWAAIFYPIRAAYDELRSSSIPLLTTQCVYVADFFISFLTAIEYLGNRLVTISDIINFRLTHYNTMLTVIFDVLCVIPFTWFYRGTNPRIYYILEINTIFKIWKVNRFFNLVESKHVLSLAFLRIIECLLWISILSFWMGSFYYLQACMGNSCRDASWFTNEIVNDLETLNASLRFTYTLDLTWFIGVVFISSSGTGDVRASTVTEMNMVTIVCLACTFIFGYFVASYTAVLILLRKSEVAFSELVYVTELFLENNSVLESIKTRVLRYLKIQWRCSQGYYILNDKSLYHDLPYHLQKELLVITRREQILSIPLLEDTEASLINYIANNAVSYTLPPEEVIVYAGEFCTEFYMLEEGFCKKYSGISSELECIISPKGNFCIMEVLFGIPSPSEVRTATYVKLLGVNRQQLLNALCHFPATRNEIMKIVKEYQENDVLGKVLTREKKSFEGRQTKKDARSWVTFQRNHEDYKKPFRHDWTKYIRFFLLPITLMPNGYLLKLWEFVRIVCILLSCVFYPTYSYMWLEFRHTTIIRIFFDIICVIDMYILMHVCYYTEEGILVIHPKATFKYYLSHNFIIDLIVLIPFDVLAAMIEVENEPGYYRYVTLGDYVYFNKLLSFYRLRSIKEFVEVGESKIYEKYCKDPLFIICCVIVLNVWASVLVILTADIIFKADGSHYKIRYEGRSWVTSKPFNSLSLLNVHIMAVYWTSTMVFGVAFGDITALNSLDMMYCVVIFLMGYVLITYMMVRSTSTQTGLGMYYTTCQQNLKQMIFFLKNENVSVSLRSQVISHFEHVWSVTHSLDTQSIFSKFHIALQEDAVLFLYESTFTKCPMFREAEPSFFRQLGMFVNEDYYRRGSTIFQINDVISDVFFIHQGVMILTRAGDESTIYLEKGSFFGNIDDCAAVRVTCSVKAVTHAVLLKLNNRNFYKLLKEFHYSLNHIIQTVSENKIYVVPIQKTVIPLEKNSDDIVFPKSASIPSKCRRFCKDLQMIHIRIWKQIHKLWYHFIVICSIVSYIVIVYHVAFQEHSLTIFTLEIVLNFIFAIHLLLSIFAPIPSADYTEKNDMYYRKEKYFSRAVGFWLDLMCCLPLYILCFATPIHLRYLVWSCLQCSFLIRTYHIVKYCNIGFEDINQNMILINLMQISVFFTLLMHSSACLLYAAACFRNSCPKNSWASVVEKDEEKLYSACPSVYVCALYYAVTIYTSSGVGDIVPTTIADVCLVTILIVLGKYCLAILIGKMSAVLVDNIFTLSNYNYKASLLMKFLKCCDLSYPLIQTIESYAERLWYDQYGQQRPVFFNQLPSSLLSSLKNEMYGHHISDSALFSGCHPDFLRQLAEHLIRRRFFPDNIIVQSGEINGCMYFVRCGEVEVLSVNNLKVTLTDILTAGDTFGIVQGLYKKTPHTHTFRALTATVILILRYDDWRNLLAFFPQSHKDLYEKIYLFSFVP